MSKWSYIKGIITVYPFGRCNNEKEYILKQVLNHLPKVTGSEEDMFVDIIPEHTYSMSSNADEYGNHSNLGVGYFDNFETKCIYHIILTGNFRDRTVYETNKEFQKWLCRLVKRIGIEDIFVRIYGNNIITSEGKHLTVEEGYNEECAVKLFDEIILNDPKPYSQLYESPSWSDENSHNWCEHLMYRQSEIPYEGEYEED